MWLNQDILDFVDDAKDLDEVVLHYRRRGVVPGLSGSTVKIVLAIGEHRIEKHFSVTAIDALIPGVVRDVLHGMRAKLVAANAGRKP